MSATFGVHVGNSCACIAVSKDGKTDVVANAAGDRYISVETVKKYRR